MIPASALGAYFIWMATILGYVAVTAGLFIGVLLVLALVPMAVEFFP